MSPFASGYHAEHVAADVGTGFVATEAPALQKALRAALRAGESKGRAIPADLAFRTGAAERVVVEWRNQYVGFVPTSHLATLRGQLAGAGRAKVVAPGQVYWDGAYWRVWVGPPPPAGFPAVEPGYDELTPPPSTIFGVRVDRTPGRP